VKITTAAEMAAIDRATTTQHGISSLTLMENAGCAVADFALEHWPLANRITVVCGRGNNGGDGFVAARRLHAAGKVVEVLLLGPSEGLRPDAAAMLARLPLRPTLLLTTEEVMRESFRSLAESDLIVDAVFGTGYQRRAEITPAGQLADAAIAAINSAHAPVLSVDLPSGADADSTSSAPPESICRSSAVITFTAPKPAHLFAPLSSGPIVVAAIGSPTEAIVSEQHLHAITPQNVTTLFAPRPAESNKGRFGHVLVVAGSLGKAGAAAMSAMAALRIGAGLVTVATPSVVLSTVAGFAPELMTEPLGHSGAIFVSASDAAHCLEIAKSRTVLAVGPGLSQHNGVADFVRRLVKGAHQPIVLDADGLNAFDGSLKDLAGHHLPLILTPHPGEMARLLGVTVAQVQADRIAAARDFARRLRCILVLKGFRTIVASPSGELWIAATGNPGLATGGTGDILTGMIAGAIAQFPQQIEEAVRAAVFLHGLAGDAAAARLGQESLVATDLLRSLPVAFRIVRRRAARTIVQLC
jgi:NAD(P)H-hydrate epimerase